MAAMKLALALLCLIAFSGAASAAQQHSRNLRLLYTIPDCESTVEAYVAADNFGTIKAGTASSGPADQPQGDASKFVLTTGPNGAGVQGFCARNLCIALGKKLGKELQVANLEQLNAKRVAGPLVFGTIGADGAYINTAPSYETPRDIATKPTSGPVGRNNLVLKAENPAGDYTVSPPSEPAGKQTPGSGADSLAVVCGPPRDPVFVPPTFCTSPEDEFQGWAITNAAFPAAGIVCPFGYTLGNVAANNLFKSDQSLYNPNNLFDQSGFPYLQDLIAFCAPGERVWVNTAPGFTSGNPAGSPPGSPGYCVTISEGFKGNPQGVDPKYTGGKPVPNDPKCLESHKALCFLSSSV